MSNNPFTISGNVSLGLEGKYRTNWVENTLDLDNETNGALGSSHTKTYIGGSMTKQRMLGLLVIIGIGLLVILVRTFYLQGMHGNYYFALAENNRLREQPIPAERGIIYDRFGTMLVQNIPSFSLAIIPQDLPRTVISGKTVIDPNIIDQIATLSSVSTTAIQNLLTRYGTTGYEPLTIKELDYDDALKLYTNSDIPGFELESGSERLYMTSSTKGVASSTLSLSPILGYVGKIEDETVPAGYLKTDVIGKAGVEKTYESALRGSYGTEELEVNAVGKEQKVLSVNPPTPGQNLVLTIDAEAQAKLESLVKETAEKTGHRSIAAIAMNPQNGEILAMVSWPSYDNNAFSGGIDQKTYDSYLNDPDHPLLDRAIAGEYAPGSTFKLIMASAGLQEKVITPYTTVDSVGGVQLGDRLFRDWKVGGSGITNVTKALAWSVNTFFYYVGGGYQDFQGLGVDRIDKYMWAFGLGQKTGIDLPGEATGFVPTKESHKASTGQDWFQGDTYNISIGQGDTLVTPLQDALWTAQIANGGIIVTPHVGLKIVSATSTQILQFPTRKNSAVDLSNIQVVQQGLRDCVTYGACKLLQDLPFDAAGKTGTAQIGDTSHAWFTSYAPYENPQIVVTIVVEKGGEGSTIAMPVANQFLAWWGQKYLHK